MPCWSEEDCWARGSSAIGGRPAGSARVGLQLVSANGSNWSRFVNLIHVRCNSPRLAIAWDPIWIQGGELHLFWDGKEINEQNGFEVLNHSASPLREETVRNWTSHWRGAQRAMRATVALPTAGGHELRLEFTPDANATRALAVLASLQLWMPLSYATCEDLRACVSFISDSDAAVRQFRNSNEAQYRCLTNVEPSSACATWKACLEQAGAGADKRSQRLINLLTAAGVGSQPEAVTTTTTEASWFPSLNIFSGGGEEEGPCLDPRHEDVQAWDCDCYDALMASCDTQRNQSEYSDAKCVRAQLCKEPRICAAWKARWCDPEHLALLSRRSAQSRTASLDAAADNKRCP